MTVCVFNNLREKFVTWRNNGILPPINEFARPYQSKNNGIYAARENEDLSSLLGLERTSAPDRDFMGAEYHQPDARKAALHGRRARRACTFGSA
jgi:hypothetical protein